MRVADVVKKGKSRLAVVMAGLAVAAGLAAAPQAAEAQVRFGVVVGGPRYAVPVAPGYGYGYAAPVVVGPRYAPPVVVAPPVVYGGYGWYGHARGWGRRGWR